MAFRFETSMEGDFLMRNYCFADHNSLTISTKETIHGERTERIKNDLLWDINAYLRERFELYDFSKSINPFRAGSYVKAIPLNDFRKKMLHIYHLDKMFIDRVVIDEEEIRQQHEMIDPKMEYAYFRELCAVETVDMEYFAVKSLQEFELAFRQNNKGSSTKEIIRAIKQIADVYAAMYDSTSMELYFNDISVKDDILSIAKAHCIQTDKKWP